MNPVLSLCNSLSMNKQVCVPGGGNDCGQRGGGVLTVCQILRLDTRPPSAPPPHQMEVTQILYLLTTRESQKKKKKVKHRLTIPKHQANMSRAAWDNEPSASNRTNTQEKPLNTAFLEVKLCTTE